MKTLFLLLIFFNLNIYAQETFLGSVDLTRPTISFENLLETITTASYEKDAVALSVGESHLHSETALKINGMVISAFFKESSSNIITCLETLSHFNQSEIGKYVFEASFKTKIYEGNSPARTDFKKCYETNNSHYLIYSGFFHQYPFARPFPLEFPVTSVTRDAGNNILDQMKETKRIFVTQMELEFLEFTATKALVLKLKETKDIFSFKENAKKLILNTEMLVMAMKPLVQTDSIFTSKSGVVLSQNNFKMNLNGVNNYFILTNFDYRSYGDTLGFLKMLLLLDDTKLLKFVKKLETSKLFMTTLFVVPDAVGNLPQTSYGSADFTFKGNTYILHLVSDRESTLFTFSPKDKEPHCIDYKTIQQVACF